MHKPTTRKRNKKIKLQSVVYFFGCSIGLAGLILLLSQLLFGEIHEVAMWRAAKLASSQSSFPMIAEECDPQWPDLDFYLATADGNNQYFNWFLPSLALFWPKNKTLKLLISTDGDNPQSQYAKNAQVEARKLIPEIQVRSALTRSLFPFKPWDKIQWLKFWADNFTNSEYVGFVDPDTVFVTAITLPDLFIDNKPIVRPIYGKPRIGLEGNWHIIPQMTYDYTGYKEPFNCLTFLPFIIKTAHLRVVRERVMKRLNVKTFDQAVEHFIKKVWYSEHNIMCAIMWWEFRDDYYWVINESEEGWNGPAPPGQVANLVEAQIPEKWLKRLRPHIAVHWVVNPLAKEPNGLRDAMRTGYCYGLNEGQYRPEFCSAVNRTKINELEFLFEYDNFSKRQLAIESHLARIEQSKQCPHVWRGERVSALLLSI